jgi:hypothetical protein
MPPRPAPTVALTAPLCGASCELREPDEIAGLVIASLCIRDNQGDGDARIDPFGTFGRLYASIIAVGLGVPTESVSPGWVRRSRWQT